MFYRKVILISDSQKIRRAGNAGVLCAPNRIALRLRHVAPQQAISLQPGKAIFCDQCPKPVWFLWIVSLETWFRVCDDNCVEVDWLAHRHRNALRLSICSVSSIDY